MSFIGTKETLNDVFIGPVNLVWIIVVSKKSFNLSVIYISFQKDFESLNSSSVDWCHIRNQDKILTLILVNNSFEDGYCTFGISVFWEMLSNDTAIFTINGSKEIMPAAFDFNICFVNSNNTR